MVSLKDIIGESREEGLVQQSAIGRIEAGSKEPCWNLIQFKPVRGSGIAT